ncbi:hypothetical protein GALMADRAFT_817637 [Galerina marginata CBS 339.88]|uniref:Uncharacterized protein n=1 Tax=Galerina marginata (strain CBS 339.88) TaxID=685588 RepID=A0A067TR07_GALM3|nr:hypothetical protein GALMADRAFT_817637 [Galerina marginata CBS 339.88]
MHYRTGNQKPKRKETRRKKKRGGDEGEEHKFKIKVKQHKNKNAKTKVNERVASVLPCRRSSWNGMKKKSEGNFDDDDETSAMPRAIQASKRDFDLAGLQTVTPTFCACFSLQTTIDLTGRIMVRRAIPSTPAQPSL